MYKINSFGATVDNEWTNGNPSTATPATVLDAPWFNALQRELVAVIEAAGLTLDEEDDTQLLQALGITAGAVPSTRNFLVNGDMRVAQRRKTATFTNGTVLTGFVLDRWLHSADGGGGTGQATGTRQAFTLGQVAVPGDPRFFLRHNQTVAANVANPTVSQKVEGVRGFSGGEVTLGVWLLGASSFNVTLRVVQNFGTGGSPSSPVVCGTQAVAVTTSWAKAELTVTLPSISGKTLGSAGNDHLLVEIQGPTGATFTLNVSRAQLEGGAVAGDFEVRPLTHELALCQRYFEKSYEAETDPGTVTALGASKWMNGWSGGAHTTKVEAEARFAVEKRAAPAIVWYSPASGATGNYSGFSSGDLAILGTAAISKRSTGYPTTSVTGTLDAVGSGVHWAADAEI